MHQASLRRDRESCKRVAAGFEGYLKVFGTFSLRNVNAVLVFDSDFQRLRHMFIGPFVRQHDPDFIDGDSIRLFDNYTHTADSENPRSRLITLTVNSRKEQVLFTGSEIQPFFTNIMGKQQLLANGNYLLTEAKQGRAIEIDSGGKIVLEYNNPIGPGLVGITDEAQRLGAGFDKEFIEQAQQRCEQPR